MKNSLKAKFKTIGESPATITIMTGVALAAVAVAYTVFDNRRTNVYINHLETQRNSFAMALDKTTESIITALHPE